MHYVILHPHSITNESDEYLVVGYRSWVRSNNETDTAYDVASRHKEYDDARWSRDKLNEAATRAAR